MKEVILIKEKYYISDEDRKASVELLIENLPSLRARLGIRQEEGVYRQTYYSLETGKSAMLWVIFPSIIFFFDSVRKTAEMLRVLRIYPIDLVLRFNGELEIIMNRLSNGEMCNEAD